MRLTTERKVLSYRNS